MQALMFSTYSHCWVLKEYLCRLNGFSLRWSHINIYILAVTVFHCEIQCICVMV